MSIPFSANLRSKLRSSIVVVTCLVLLIFGVSQGPVSAQSYPTRPIKLVVPYTPGTGYDTIARVIGPLLGDKLGEPVVIENRPGASSTIGAIGVARSPADGQTLLMIGEGTIAAQHLYSNISFDPIKDLSPIALTGFGTLVVVASNASQTASMKDLIDRARSQKSKLTYGSPGVGTSQHLKMELIKGEAGIELQHVPYKGSAGVMNDLLGGHVDLALVPIHQALAALNAKQLVPLAVVSDARNRRLPDVPTLSETGIRNVEAKMWYAMVAPTGTPEPIISRLTSEIAGILKNPEVNTQLYRIGIDVSYKPPSELHEVMKQESANALAIISKAKIALQ